MSSEFDRAIMSAGGDLDLLSNQDAKAFNAYGNVPFQFPIEMPAIKGAHCNGNAD